MSRNDVVKAETAKLHVGEALGMIEKAVEAQPQDGYRLAAAAPMPHRELVSVHVIPRPADDLETVFPIQPRG